MTLGSFYGNLLTFGFKEKIVFSAEGNHPGLKSKSSDSIVYFCKSYDCTFVSAEFYIIREFEEVKLITFASLYS